jgi:hypothetical protein
MIGSWVIERTVLVVILEQIYCESFIFMSIVFVGLLL